MGFFSWKTSDTKESIPNVYSTETVFEVHMVAPDGRKWTEPAYQGYGVFGGKDIYELIAELNGFDSDRLKGIDLVFTGLDGKLNNSSGCFNVAADSGIKLPKLFKSPDLGFSSYFYPDNCEYQGFFYPTPVFEGDEDEDFYEFDSENEYNDDVDSVD